jgi:hypothetical protein
MKNVRMNLGLKLAFLAAVNLFASGLSAAAPSAPSSFHFVCSSSEIGVVDIKLNNAQQLTIGDYIRYYDMTVTQSSLQGTLLAQNTYDKRNENFAHARLWMREPVHSEATVIHFRIPSAGPIDWSQHPNDCHVTASAPGVWFGLNLETMAVNIEQYEEPTIQFSMRNPRVESRVVTDVGFGRLEEYLNNQKCSTSDDYRRARQTVQCQKID